MADSKPLLDAETFKTIVDATPLVSIDLLVRDSDHQILVGRRINRPAQGYWFVPGGRIRKNERLTDAFLRLTEQELGVSLSIESARYLGLYEHFYSDSVFGDGVSTHYVVHGFEVVLPGDNHGLPKEQHSDYRWLSETEFRASDEVHLHSRWYVDQTKGLRGNL